jgi:putative ABC transport system permease protein
VNAREVSSQLFSVFRVAPVAGRAFLPEEDRPGGAPVVVISHDLWQRRYGGNRAAIGSPLVLDGTPYTIVGIAPTGLTLDGDASVFIPLGQDPTPRMRNRQANFIHVVARIRDDATSAEAQTELATISRRLEIAYPDANTGTSFFARSLLQESVGDVQAMLWLLLAAVSVVVLIACVNVANLLLARAVSREREFAMRAALGASRGRLMRQCLTESALLGLCGGAFGVVIAAVTVRPFVLLWPGNLPRAQEIDLDWRVLAFALGVSLFSGFLFGIAPALRAPARALEQRLRRGARGTGGEARLHRGFVISEIALAVILLVAAGMLGRTMLRLSALDPGVDIKNVLTSHVALAPATLQSPARMRAAWRDVLSRANATPGVHAAALSDIIPMRVGLNALGYWTSPTPPPVNQLPIALASCVTPEYLSVMRLPLRAGRFLDDHDRLDTEPVVVIDEVLAQRAFPQQNAVGQHLWVQAMGKDPVRVVGVVGHVRHWGLGSDDVAQIRDQIYYPFSQVPDGLMRLFSSVMSMTVRTDVPPANVAESLRRNLRSVSVLYETRTMEDLAGSSLARQRFLMTLLGISAVVAMLLACVGIYGVLSYLTSQRVPEFGVRMALGATAGDVMRLVLRQSLGMLVTGILVGIVGAVGAARLLRTAADGIQPVEMSTVAWMTGLLMISGWIATLVPARRAARVDAVEALRDA